MTFKQWLCWIGGGHDRLLHTEGDTITLRCVSCAHDTPGWSTGPRRFVPRYAGDPTRHRLNTVTPLVLVRNRSRKMRR